MALKWKLTKAEHGELDGPTRGLYREDGEFFTLDADPHPDLDGLRGKVDEFRKNNKALAAQLESANRPVTPRPEDASIAAEFAALKRDYDKTKAELQAERDAASHRQFSEAVRTEGAKYGLHKDAAQDLVNRASAAGFKHDGKNIVAFDAEGKVLSSKHAGNAPLTLNEWMAEQRENGAGHLFQRSQGVGGGPVIVGMPQPKQSGQIVVDASPEFRQRNLDKIASGEIILQTSGNPHD